MADARRIVDLGRTARSTSGVKLRQPLSRLVVEGATPGDGLAAIVREELRVKALELGRVESKLVVKPNLPVLGPRLGKELGAVRAALAAGEFDDLGAGRFRAAGQELSPGDVLVERSAREGWAIASSDGVTVALDTSIDEGLEREARVYELIHRVNSMRKEAGLALTDRIALTLPAADADLLEHADWIKEETLATSLEASGDAPSIVRA
jgi:isoleucyl-tRNA synthetase